MYVATDKLYETRDEEIKTPMHVAVKFELKIGLMRAHNVYVDFSGFKYVAACYQKRKPTKWTNFLGTRLVYGPNIPSTPEDAKEHPFESRQLLSLFVCMPPFPRQQIWSWRRNDLRMKIFVLHQRLEPLLDNIVKGDSRGDHAFGALELACIEEVSN
jgi:hypothetical protein